MDTRIHIIPIYLRKLLKVQIIGVKIKEVNMFRQMKPKSSKIDIIKYKMRQETLLSVQQPQNKMWSTDKRPIIVRKLFLQLRENNYSMMHMIVKIKMNFNLSDFSFFYNPAKLINPSIITLVSTGGTPCSPIVTISILNSASKLLLSIKICSIWAFSFPILTLTALRYDLIFS